MVYWKVPRLEWFMDSRSMNIIVYPTAVSMLTVWWRRKPSHMCEFLQLWCLKDHMNFIVTLVHSNPIANNYTNVT